jgi:hypothetical protein
MPMFLPTSRYARVATVEAKTSTGETVTAIKLRRLIPVSGQAQTVQAGDRLDLLAFAVTGNGTHGWHIADANTALDARTLCETPGNSLLVPER